MLSRRTSLPLLFLQSATLNWRPLLYILRIPAYNTLNATRDATLTKITLVTNRELNRDERSFSREFTLRRYIILNDYIRCEGGYLSSNRILSFFFLPLLSQFSQPDSLLFCSSITGNATCKSPMRIPARQPYTVNTRKNVHACKSGGAARMRGTHAPTACNPQSKYMGQTPPSACVGVLQPPTTIPTIQPHIHTANPLDYEDTSRRTSPLINTRRSTPARNTILRVLLPGPIFGIVHGVYRCAMRNSILRIRPFVSRILHGDSFQFFSFFEKNEDHRYNKIVRNFFNRFPKKLI